MKKTCLIIFLLLSLLVLFAETASPQLSSSIGKRLFTHPSSKVSITSDIKADPDNCAKDMKMSTQPTEPLNPPVSVTAVTSANNVNITWQAPGGIQSGFSDSFETYPDFTLSFAPWTLFDVDLATTYGFSEYTFPNSGAPMAYIIFNPGATTPPLNAQTHSGSKMAACFAAQIPPNSDWLITPRIAGAYQLKFWARSYVADYGLERFKVGVSTNVNALPATFNIISGANYISVPTTWTEYVYDLSTYASTPIYIGIRCVSNDAFILFVDDVVVNNIIYDSQPSSPTHSETVTENKNDTRSVTGYKVWRLAQGQETNEAAWTLLTPTAILSLSYTDTGWSELVGGTYKWAVKAEYTGGLLSNPTLSNALVKPNQPTNVLNLVSGWNLVSLNVSPTNHSIESLISAIEPNVMQIKGIEGVYIPGNPFSTLTSLADGKAYNIQMSSPQTWTVYGNPIAVSTPLALVDGWNMVAYLPQSPVPVATATQSIITWLRQIKGTDGVYIPGNPFSTLGSMAPNKGYWIELSGAHNLIYPGAGKQEADFCAESPHIPVSILPTGMTLLASCEVAEAGDILLAKVGDELRGAESFLDISGNCGVLIQIYTETAGEEIHFSILKPDGSELPILTTLSSQPQGTIGSYPNFMVLKQKAGDDMQVVCTSLDACYPNPFNPSTTISFSVAQDNSHVCLDVFNIKGQRITRLLNTPLPGGKHTVTWNGKNDKDQSVASGIYFIHMNAGGYSKTIKALLSK